MKKVAVVWPEPSSIADWWRQVMSQADKTSPPTPGPTARSKTGRSEQADPQGASSEGADQ